MNEYTKNIIDQSLKLIAYALTLPKDPKLAGSVFNTANTLAALAIASLPPPELVAQAAQLQAEMPGLEQKSDALAASVAKQN